MIRIGWSCGKWGLLLVLVVTAVTVPYLYHRLDEEIRRQVEARLAAHYPHLAVRVRSAQFLESEGIEIRGLSIHEPGISGPQAELAYVEEVFLSSSSDLRQLLAGELSISRIAIRRPLVRVARNADGTWSAAKLLPLPQLTRDPPRGTIEGGTIELTQTSPRVSRSYVLRDINLEFGPAAKNPASEETPRLSARGYLSGDHVERIEIDATFDRAGLSWQASGLVEGLEVSPELAASLPGNAAQGLAKLGSLRGQVREARFTIARRDDGSGGLSYSVNGQFRRGRMDEAYLPYPLTDLASTFHLDARGFTLDELSAKSGQTLFSVERAEGGFTPQSPLKLVASGRRLVLDRKLLAVLPRSWHGEWDKFLPEGEVDADLQLSFDGKVWHPSAKIKLLGDVSFTYHRFPYRLERASGKLLLRDGALSIDVKAQGEGEEVRLTGNLLNPGPQATGWVELRGDNLRLDEKLFQALDDKPRDVVRSLHPRGTFDCEFRCWHDKQSPPLWRKQLTMRLKHCSLNYDRFPYPLDNIRGTIEMNDGAWHFKPDLTGTNDTGRIQCEGHLVPRRGGNELVLSFRGEHVPLEEELRNAMSKAAQDVWNDLKPRGTIESLEAIISCQPGQVRPKVWILAEPLFDPESNQSVSIEPRLFPYRWENLRGKFTYDDGRIGITGLRAEHQRTVLSAKGQCQLEAGGGWRLVLEPFAVDRLRADADLVQALSGRLKKAIGDLRPGGPMNVRGRCELAKRDDPARPFSARWDLNIDFQQGSLDCGVKLDHLNGSVSVEGGFNGERFHSFGDLNISSMFYRDFQLAQVEGPFWIDDKRALFGAHADRHRGIEPQRRIRAQLYGGTALADGNVTFGQSPRFWLDANLVQADLARYAQESIAGHQKLAGQVWASIALHGHGSGLHNLSGFGNVQLRDANLYELPLMLALLKTLFGRAPDTTAFNKAEVVFRIEGEHVYLDPINCTGDAISLKGKGEMGLDKQIRLAFYAVVGRGERHLPVLPEILGGASQQIMLIHVDGTLDEPTTHREVFPGVAQALQQFQSEGAVRVIAPRDTGGAAAQRPQAPKRR